MGYTKPVTYRADRTTLEQRAERAEAKLEAAQTKIARLEGKDASVEMVDQNSGWFLGQPGQFDMQRKLPLELTGAGYEAVAAMLKNRSPNIQVSQVGRTLDARIAGLNVSVARTGDGETTVRVTADHRGYFLFLGAGIAGAVFGGLGPMVALLRWLQATPFALLAALPMVMVASWWLLRTLLGRRIVKSRSELLGLLETTCEVAAQHATRTPSRIETEGPSTSEPHTSEGSTSEDEALAAEEAERSASDAAAFYPHD